MKDADTAVAPWVLLRRKMRSAGRKLLVRTLYGNVSWKKAVVPWIARQNIERIKRLHPELDGPLSAIMNDRHAMKWCPKASDAWYLMEQVRKLNANCVVEMGSGCSTIALIYAMKKQFEKTGKTSILYTFEEHREYFDRYVGPHIPKSWAPHFKLVIGTPEIGMFSREDLRMPGIFFKEVRDLKAEPDLIYIDGPATVHKDHYLGKPHEQLANVRKNLMRPFDADLYWLSQKMKKNTRVVLDQRIDTRWAWGELTQGRVKGVYVPTYNKSVIEVNSDSFKGVEAMPLGRS